MEERREARRPALQRAEKCFTSTFSLEWKTLALGGGGGCKVTVILEVASLHDSQRP